MKKALGRERVLRLFLFTATVKESLSRANQEEAVNVRAECKKLLVDHSYPYLPITTPLSFLRTGNTTKRVIYELLDIIYLWKVEDGDTGAVPRRPQVGVVLLVAINPTLATRGGGGLNTSLEPD